MDTDTLLQLEQIGFKMRDTIYTISHPEFMLFDLDSTLLNTYGNQEGEDFNYHYQAHGYHPLLKYAGDAEEELNRATRYNQVDYAVTYGEFMYQASSWSHPRRVENFIKECNRGFDFAAVSSSTKIVNNNKGDSIPFLLSKTDLRYEISMFKSSGRLNLL